MPRKFIPFSPPDITRLEIKEVIDTLKSGWITTGPKVKKFEEMLRRYCSVKKAVCLSSATAGLELILRLFEISEGDEVITTPYTYAATANVILHTGARPVFVDVKKGGFNIDPDAVGRALTPRTKAVISVDFGGLPCDYDRIKEVLDQYKNNYNPKKGTLQEKLQRPLFLSDAAHSFGAEYKGKKLGGCADFTVFSFHAVKNLTTAEGGAVVFDGFENDGGEEIEKTLRLLLLHGQSKDALSKMQLGSWRYSIELPGYKYNMTDIHAALGIAQLRRFEKEMIPNRKKIVQIYKKEFGDDERLLLPVFKDKDRESSYHLYPLRLRYAGEKKRDWLIEEMAKNKIALNVHFIPVVMHPAYTRLGYSINNYPNTYNAYQSEVSLPLYSTLTAKDARTVCCELKKALDLLEGFVV